MYIFLQYLTKSPGEIMEVSVSWECCTTTASGTMGVILSALTSLMFLAATKVS